MDRRMFLQSMGLAGTASLAANRFSPTGNFHFLDAQDMHMLRDGEKIDPSLLNF